MCSFFWLPFLNLLLPLDIEALKRSLHPILRVLVWSRNRGRNLKLPSLACCAKRPSNLPQWRLLAAINVIDPETQPQFIVHPFHCDCHRLASSADRVSIGSIRHTPIGVVVRAHRRQTRSIVEQLHPGLDPLAIRALGVCEQNTSLVKLVGVGGDESQRRRDEFERRALGMRTMRS